LPRAYGHRWLITACRKVANLTPDMAPDAGRRGILYSVKRGLKPRSDRVPIWEPEPSDLRACTRTCSDAERSAEGAPAALGGKGITWWMAATGFPNVNSSGEDIDFV
jgi:hypothetical protein